VNKEAKAAARRATHGKTPGVIVGKSGITTPIIGEINRHLEKHGFAKVRLPLTEKSERDPVVADLALRTQSQIAQKVGGIVVYFRDDVLELMSAKAN
jgi:RNA-binding protein